MRRIGRGLLGLGTAILVIAVFMATLAPLAIAEGSDTGHNPVTICHRTDSETNPYVVITVDQDAVDGDLGNDNGRGDHYREHVGPVFEPGMKAQKIEWGDIIPPIEGIHSGLNWTAKGRVIWENDCKPVPTTTTTTRATTTTTKATTTTTKATTTTTTTKATTTTTKATMTTTTTVIAVAPTTTAAPTTPSTLPFTGFSAGGVGGAGVAMLLLGGLITLATKQERRKGLHRA